LSPPKLLTKKRKCEFTLPFGHATYPLWEPPPGAPPGGYKWRVPDEPENDFQPDRTDFLALSIFNDFQPDRTDFLALSICIDGPMH